MYIFMYRCAYMYTTRLVHFQYAICGAHIGLHFLIWDLRTPPTQLLWYCLSHRTIKLSDCIPTCKILQLVVQFVENILLAEQMIASRTLLILLVPFENFEYTCSTTVDPVVVDFVEVYPVENQVPKQIKGQVINIMHEFEYTCVSSQPQLSGTLPGAVA